MSKIIIGIQGAKGSTNEEAAQSFIEKHGWKNVEIQYLITSDAVLQAVEKAEVDYGTFAVFVSAGLLVEESLVAMSKYLFEPVDAIRIRPQHALLAKKGEIDRNHLTVQGNIYSHPMALAMHSEFLAHTLPGYTLTDASDTGLFAEKLSKGELPLHSLVIAPHRAAKIYDLDVIYMPDELPINATYFTEILLVKKRQDLSYRD